MLQKFVDAKVRKKKKKKKKINSPSSWQNLQTGMKKKQKKLSPAISILKENIQGRDIQDNQCLVRTTKRGTWLIVRKEKFPQKFM